ncbi:MAG: hypothetical protein ACXWR4_20750, partial [Bdellovibrionota bacterium]
LEVREISDKICEIFARNGRTVVGYRSADLPLFQALEPEAQKNIVQKIRVYLECMEAVEAAGDPLYSSSKSVWHALTRLGLVPPHDLLEHLKNDALVEIYDLAGFQIWRNFKFMEFCSYTLEEVYCIEWHRRYARDPKITEECFAIIGNVVAGNTPSVHMPELPFFRLEETCSEERLVYSARHELFSPMKNRDRQVEAFLVMTSATILGGTRPESPISEPKKESPQPSPLRLV